MKTKILGAMFGAVLGIAQQATPVQSAPAAAPAPVASIDKNAPEVATHDTQTNFSTRVNLVSVPVIIRDSKGKAIGTLKQGDFQLFDKGKLQTITRFSVENANEKAANQAARMKEAAGAAGEGLDTIPTRFVAYVFDDLHMATGDLMNMRNAARKHLLESLPATDRAAIFTTSGILNLDFTGDHAALDEAMAKIQPRSNVTMPAMECPPVTYYMADQIQKGDSQARTAAVQDALACGNLDPATQMSTAQMMADGAVARAVNRSDHDVQTTLAALNDILNRMKTTPGQRAVVLMSPGFYVTNDYRSNVSALTDKALHSNIVISAIDARGLYTIIAGGDASESRVYLNQSTQILKDRFRQESALVEGDVLGDLSEGSGGTWFHNSNDLPEGLKRAAVSPEYQYILGFSPQNLKFDGSFHGLKVVVKAKDISIQSRRGFYAPRHAPDDAEQAKEEVREAFFSLDEMAEIPVAMQTQFFKVDADKAKISVLAKVDLREAHFKKADGRNLDTITIVTGLFDRNGNMIEGLIKTVDLKLKDETFEQRLNSGLQVKTSFDAPPGKYSVRVVVRDANGQAMAAKNGVVEVP